VISKPKIVLDARDYRAIYAQIVARHGQLHAGMGETPEKSAGAALGAAAARFIGTSFSGLNQAPDKNKLAFLDNLGLGLVPAQAARTPLGVSAFGGPGKRYGARGHAGAPHRPRAVRSADCFRNRNARWASWPAS